MDETFLQIDSVFANLKATSTKQVLQQLARQAAQDTGLAEKYLLDRLSEQERRETSGIGYGVAIPHLRLGKLGRPYTLFARLDRSVDFESLDGKPVDLVFMLLSPARDVAGHLRRLSRLSRLARSEGLRRGLRGVEERDACRALLQNAVSGALAA